MKTYTLILLVYLFAGFIPFATQAQNVTITPNGITPASTYPRLNHEAILALPNPQAGDTAYDLTFRCLRIYNGNKWLCSYQDPTTNTPDMALVTTIAGTSTEFAKGVAVDNKGYVYVTGYFRDTVSFGNISRISAGNDDIFLAKYSYDGTLQWAQKAGGTGEDRAVGLVVDTDGNAYITGHFSGTATFGNTSETSTGGTDIFIAKYTSSGNLAWIKTPGGTQNDAGRAITIDNDNNVYITGEYRGIVNFGTKNDVSAGEADIFILKYSSNGGLLWAQTEGGTGNETATCIAVNNAGMICVAGYFYDNTKLGGVVRTSVGSSDAFVIYYQNTTFQWAKTFGGEASDIASGVALNNIGWAYVTGIFNGTVNFSGTSKTSAGSSDIFLIVLESYNGNTTIVNTAGGVFDDTSRAIRMVGSDIYLTGHFSAASNFDNILKSTRGGSDIFIAKLNSSGNFLWVNTAGGTSSDEGSALALDNNNNIFVCGHFYINATFGNFQKTATSFDAYLLRLK